MAATMTTREASVLWGISPRRVNIFCQTGRIPGAYKEGKQWIIPSNAQKPVDKRLKKEHISVSKEARLTKKLPLPIGISDYCKACSEYYYVDKTLLIRDFLDERPTYFMALKDSAGLVKMYAMVNVQQYQIVGTGETVAYAQYSERIRLLWQTIIGDSACSINIKHSKQQQQPNSKNLFHCYNLLFF